MSFLLGGKDLERYQHPKYKGLLARRRSRLYSGEAAVWPGKKTTLGGIAANARVVQLSGTTLRCNCEDFLVDIMKKIWAKKLD